jgi:hypothetical protein
MMKRKNLALMLAACAGAAVSSAAMGQYNIVTTQPGTFIDISATGTFVVGGDDASGPVMVPAVAANLLCPAGTLNVSTNGNCGYNAITTAFTNTTIPSSTFHAGNTAFAVFWDDLITQAGPNAGVYSQLMGDVLIIQWNNMDHYFTSPSPVTFQMKIFGGAGGPGGAMVQFIYQDVDFGDPLYNNGASATVGYQTSATMGQMYSFDSPVINNGMVLSIMPPSNDPGACCMSDGTCTFVSQVNCFNAGGVFTSVGTTCAQANCPQPAACCLSNGTCISATPASCSSQGGIFQGAGSTCGTITCPSSLSTLFAHNNYGNPGGAIYFDITVGPNPLTIQGLATNTDALASFGYSVYTTGSSHVGNEGNPGVWTLQTTGTGTGAGIDQPSIVNITSPFVLAANTTYGVALVMGPEGAHRYTNGPLGPYSNANLTLTLGSATNFPFENPVFTPRVWNGTLFYTIGGTPPVTGACCLSSGSCTTATSSACATQGGVYQGDNTNCGTINCPLPPGLWIEVGNAGNLPATAQVTMGNGPLLEIRGHKDPNDADMFKFRMCDPQSFSASTVGTTSWDTQLFVFKADGMGLVFNDDTPAGGSLQSAISSLHTASQPVGDYFIAISAYDMDPLSGGLEIWADTPFNTERTPDGPGAFGAVDSWFITGASSGAYSIMMGGSCFAVPAAPTCYPNCDGSTTPPVLNVADFSCFLSKFAAGDPYANCDGSTTPPVLNVADFSCFLSSFAAGCR